MAIMESLMTISISVTDLEPVKALVHEIANAYPTLVILAHENAEIALLVESIDKFREEIRK